MPVMTTDGFRLYNEDTGGNAPTVLFLRGAGGNEEAPDPFVAPRDARGRHAVLGERRAPLAHEGEAVMTKRGRRRAGIALSAALLAGCTPVHVWDTHTTSTPAAVALDVTDLAREPVATLGVVGPAGPHSLGPFLTHALVAALAETSPPIRAISVPEMVNALNEHELVTEYTDMLSSFARGSVLDRQRLQRVGSALGCRYALLPGVAEVNQSLIDQFEIAGIKMVRNRVVTLRLWLQLWDTRAGRLLGESSGEITTSTPLLSPGRSLPLDTIAQKLWRKMIEDDLLPRRQSRAFRED
jgi:hypothetical protein